MAISETRANRFCVEEDAGAPHPGSVSLPYNKKVV